MRQVHTLESQIQLIDAIKRYNSVVLKAFYISNYPKIETLVLRNSGSVAYVKDIYQEAFITVWRHVKNDTFIPQNDTAFEEYLYSIAENKWTDVLKCKSFKNSSSLNDTLAHLRHDGNDDDSTNDIENKKLETTMEAFKNLGRPCKKLLTTFDFDKKSLKDTASELNIEETTAHNKKYRCMEKLRAMVIA